MAGRYHDGRIPRRGCVWRAVPSRRFLELVGCLVLGAAVDAPDDIAGVAVLVARRTVELVAEGVTPPAAYEMALGDVGLAGERSA